MARQDYPHRESDVSVTFVDGEVKTYRITAGVGIGTYLAEQAANTGILVLFNGTKSHGIPLAQIREYDIVEVADGDHAHGEQPQRDD